MSKTLSDLAGGTGVVTITGDGGAVREFIVAPLSIDDEDVLFRQLEGLAESRTRQKLLDYLADVSKLGTPGWAHLATVRALAEMADVPPSASSVDRVRESLDGTAVELWHRSRSAHPGLKLDEVKAVVTNATAGSIRRQLRTITQGQAEKDKSPPAPEAGPS